METLSEIKVIFDIVDPLSSELAQACACSVIIDTVRSVTSGLTVKL